MFTQQDRMSDAVASTQHPSHRAQTKRDRTLRGSAAVCLALMAAVLVAGCASDPTDRAPTAAYRCEDGSRFTVRFDPKSASVHLANGRTITLPQQKAASGMWYSGKGYDLRGKGDDATWTADGGPATECRSV